MGFSISRYLALRGATVSMADIKAPELTTAAELIQKECPDASIMHAVIDVSKAAAVDEWIASTVATFGKLDGAANNAGILRPTTMLKDLSDEEWNRIIGVNLTGVMNCMRAELRVMGNGASIVNVSSVAGLIGLPGLAAYVASKHGVLGLTKAVAKEVAANSIRVNCVCPGAIDTPMLRSGAVKAEVYTVPAALQRVGSADDIASTVAFLLGPESSYTTGQSYAVDGGWVC